MASPSHTAPAPAEVKEISGIGDPVVRNLRITECYHRLSSAFADRTGPGANWCTFATWASRQAGVTIRGEDLLARFESALREGSFVLHPGKALWRFVVRRGVFYPRTRLGAIVRDIHTPFDAFERASDAVARGNRKVFAEIALVFSEYMERCPADALVDSPAVKGFLDSLRPGAAPEGQEHLRSAFLLYHRQSAEPDPALRAQAICLANLLIGLHEQTRLQPEIREAMESAPETFEQQTHVRRLLRPFANGIAAVSRAVTRQAVTGSMMVLGLPGGVALQLHRHLDRPIPPQLDPARDAAFGAMIAGLETADCGAIDWGDLTQRMRYIARLFRCFHFDLPPAEPPFTCAQTEAIRAGRVPPGEL
ncbi:MAG: hypothetical protein R2762_01085 [Bryobacteraceae bacterium]